MSTIADPFAIFSDDEIDYMRRLDVLNGLDLATLRRRDCLLAFAPHLTPEYARTIVRGGLTSYVSPTFAAPLCPCGERAATVGRYCDECRADRD